MNKDYLMDLMRVPKIHRQFDYDAVKTFKHWVEYVEPFLANIKKYISEGKGLVLSGDYSCGKSAIAAHILEQALEHRKVGCWIRMDEIPQIRIKDEVFDHTVGTMLSEHIEECDLLVIDELYIDDTINFQNHAAEVLIRRRVDRLKSTVITTNLKHADLKKSHPALEAVLYGQFKFVTFDKYNFRKDPQKRLGDGRSYW